jgi:hypothetical protein
VSGHPVDIAAALLTQCGLEYDEDSRDEIKTALGANFIVNLRIKEPSTLVEFLESALFAPFGFAMRLTDEGTQEFFQTREVGPASVGTITIDDLHTDDGDIWGLKEQDAANLVVWESKSFLVNDHPTVWDLNMPIDGIQEATVTVEIPAPVDSAGRQVVFGDREVRFDLPGEIEGYYTLGRVLTTGGYTLVTDSADPGAVGAGVLWLDTSGGVDLEDGAVLKIRNDANTD